MRWRAEQIAGKCYFCSGESYAFIPMKRTIFLWMTASLLIGSCAPPDLSLVNQVKRFEPEWGAVSEKVTFMDRNLRLSRRRYPQDLEELKPHILRTTDARRSELIGLQQQYQDMMRERDDIQQRFEAQKSRFLGEIEKFNEWENSLSQGFVSRDAATRDFAEFRAIHQELKTEFDKLQTELIRNLEKHNTLARRLSTMLELYTNYTIEYK
jgi:hypothetical protein